MNLDEEFPALSSLPSYKNISASKQTQQNVSIKSVPIKNYEVNFDFLKDLSQESICHDDLTSQDYGLVLKSSGYNINDVPFDIEPIKENSTFNYQNHPMMKLLQPEFFVRYDLSTLFYIFFYFTKTPQQYFAGKELKRRGWVFHKQHHTWFKIVGEPTETTDKYQIGKFEYFDHGNPENWMIRPKNEFKLEFDMIEDY